MKQILSIQSSVTLGFVGNSVAGPVLTAMGHHALLLDTIALAAHPGYGQKVGHVPTAADFADILQSLAEFDALSQIDLVITGYLGDASQIEPIRQTITTWQTQNKDAIYILDPVLGDAGTMYVTPNIAAGITTELLPIASIITPNRFELEVLCGIKVHDLDSAITAAEALLAAHPHLQAVIATAIRNQAPDDVGDLLIGRDTPPLWLPAQNGSGIGPRNIPGGGDLLTAILAGHLADGLDLTQAVSKASQTAQTIITHSNSTRDLALIEQLHLLT